MTAAPRPPAPGVRADPPSHVREDTKAVARAFPERDAAGEEWFTYDLWLVDSQQWSGRLSHKAAVARLVAEGYRESRARGKLRQARDKIRNAIAAERFRGPA